jgi:hypothetical protein
MCHLFGIACCTVVSCCIFTFRNSAEKRTALREAHLKTKEEAARSRVLKEKADLADRIRAREAAASDAAEARNASMHRTFRRAEAQLKATLAEQHAVVSEKYGKLVPGRAAARMLRIEWHKLPQPVEFRINKIRAPKSKLPSGRYGKCWRFAVGR